MRKEITVIGAFDQNGLYAIGDFLPWSDNAGRSLLRKDMGHFIQITRDSAPEAKRNVLILGRASFKAMGNRPLPGRRTIVLSSTLSADAVNAALPPEQHITVARQLPEALDKALNDEDCGNVYFIGGKEVWIEALVGGFCNAAHITLVETTDSLYMSQHAGNGTPRTANIMLTHQIYNESGLVLMQSVPVDDTWGNHPTKLLFRTYQK
jgi:dihydrofolate reductase